MSANNEFVSRVLRFMMEVATKTSGQYVYESELSEVIFMMMGISWFSY